MRKLFWSIVMLSLVVSLFGQTGNQEFRATWAITWDIFEGASSAQARMDRINKILDEHKQANMNAVLWQVRQGGTAYYESSYEPWGRYLGGADPGFDPLAYAVEEAHARGMELHAWFNTFHASSTEPGTPAGDNPDWVCRDGYGDPMPARRALSPGLPAVREYTLDVAMEIVNNYDIDGLHLDYIRWNEYWKGHPDLTSTNLAKKDARPYHELDGYNIVQREELPAAPISERYLYDLDNPYNSGIPSGYGSWEEYWRASVTEFVESLHDSIQTVKPWVRLSVAALGKYKTGGASGWNGYHVVFQDAALWYNQGFIEHLTPMHYHWTQTQDFKYVLDEDWKPNIQAGIDAGRLYSVGPYSWLFGVNKIWSRHASIVEGLRTVDWVDGFQFFSYGDWADNEYFGEAGKTFFKKKTKIRPIQQGVPSTPLAPTISLNQVDPLNYDLTITPDPGVSSDQWWVLYRSTADDITLDSSMIVDIYYGGSAFTVRETFDGLQNHNGTYFYSTSTLDRYRNESALAPSVETAAVESFAPTVINTYPGAGQIVPVNSSLKITFSKSMDPLTVASALSIAPEVNIEAMTWSFGDRELLVSFQGVLNFDTYYMVTISDDAVDVNGRALDGDANGAEGGDYSFSFTTLAVDESGPELVSSNLDLEGNTEDFDVYEVLSFVFDEEIDPNSVTDGSITLNRSGLDEEVDYLLRLHEGKSVLDIRPYEMLRFGADYTLMISDSLADTLGNQMGDTLSISFSTEQMTYSNTTMIDDFIWTGVWWDPEGSGSTVGTIGSATYFGYTSSVYVPGSSPYPQAKKGAYLSYKWDSTATSHLLREYIPPTSGTPPSPTPQTGVHFDNSYIFQFYLYGDGSNNKFRVCVDEGSGDSWATGEVSQWVTIDWVGWRLIEWELDDPASVGSWISSNNTLDGPEFRLDSFQMTWDKENGDIEGRVYLDEVRVVQKQSTVTRESETLYLLPQRATLHQNYPNPFNPETLIGYTLPREMEASLTIYDLRGREVEVLSSGRQNAGIHKFHFHGGDLSTGVYLARLVTEEGSQVQRMLLLK